MLYPEGDGAFSPAVKTTTYYGTVIGMNGVEGTITVKMTKPNKKGQFNLTVKVKTLVDKQSYLFKAKKVSAANGVAAENGALTFALEGSNKKSKTHTLAVTLGGDSLTGAFDGCMIDGARHVFADGKSAGCSAKVEVGADGVVAVPVTVRKSVKGVYRCLGFRLLFAAGGNAVCDVADLTPIMNWTKKTGEAVVAGELQFLAAGLQTVTSGTFKSYVVRVDPALEEALGPVTKSSLRLSASTGRITGSLRWKVSYADAKGRTKTKSVSGKAKGIVVNGVGIGMVTIKQDKVTEKFAFTAEPSK